jgi:hypothetical protein
MGSAFGKIGDSFLAIGMIWSFGAASAIAVAIVVSSIIGG